MGGVCKNRSSIKYMCGSSFLPPRLSRTSSVASFVSGFMNGSSSAVVSTLNIT